MLVSGRPRTAVILAHGLGTHCFPFGGERAFRPKYAHEVGTLPLVCHVVRSVQSAGVERVLVVAGFRSAAVHRAVAGCGPDITSVDVHDYAHGDARALAEAIRARGIAEDLLVVNGDVFADGDDLTKLVRTFGDAPGCSAALVDELDENEDKPSWTTVRLSRDGREIREVCGRVDGERIRLSGAYVFRAADLAALADLAGRLERAYLTEMLGRLLAEGKTIRSVRAESPIVHVDRAFDYLEANQLAVERAVQRIATAEGTYVYVGGQGRPDPRFIFPGCLVSPGARVVMEADSFIGPYESREAHLDALRDPPGGVIPIRIRGHVHVGPRSRIGLNALIEGNLVIGADCVIEDAVIEPDVLLGNGVVVRRHAVIRSRSVCGDNTRFECGADFEGVAGKGTIYMHPGQCWVVTGEGCDLGAGNFFGTWRFDSGICVYRIGGRNVRPKNERIGNACYLGDGSRTGVGVMFAPGTRVGADCMLGIGLLAGGVLEAGQSYLPRQEVTRVRTGLLTRRKRPD